MRLIDGDALALEIFSHSYCVPVLDNENKVLSEVLQMVHNAPTFTDKSVEIAKKSIELGRKVGKLEGKTEKSKSVIIIKSNIRLDNVARNYFEDKFRKEYESGIIMVPEYFDVTVVGDADGVEVRHGKQ